MFYMCARIIVTLVFNPFTDGFLGIILKNYMVGFKSVYCMKKESKPLATIITRFHMDQARNANI